MDSRVVEEVEVGVEEEAMEVPIEDLIEEATIKDHLIKVIQTRPDTNNRHQYQDKEFRGFQSQDRGPQHQHLLQGQQEHSD